MESDLGTIDLSRCGLNGSPTKVKKSYTPVRKKHGTILSKVPADRAAAEIAAKIHDAGII